MFGQGSTAKVFRAGPATYQSRIEDARSKCPEDLDLPTGNVRKLRDNTTTLEEGSKRDCRIHTGFDKNLHHRIYIREGEWKGHFGEYIASNERKEKTSRFVNSEGGKTFATLRLIHNGMIVNIPFEKLWDWYDQNAQHMANMRLTFR